MGWKFCFVDTPRCQLSRAKFSMLSPALSRKYWNSGTNPFFLNEIKHLRVPVDFSNWNKTGTTAQKLEQNPQKTD
jgi:hypothetical protein